MNPELKSLYRETLLRHSRKPKNRGSMEAANASFQLKNPLCGDIVTLYLEIEEALISRVTFEAQCCSICMASASMLTEQVSGRKVDASVAFASSLIVMLNDPKRSLEIEGNEEIQSLSGVKSFPSRIRCATLPWEAFREAVSQLK